MINKKGFSILTFSLSLIIGVFMCPLQAADDQKGVEKPKIGIMKFEVGEDVKPSRGQILYDYLMQQVVMSKQFTVVDWEEIDRVLKYISESQPNISQEEARKQAINQIGLEKMYLGYISSIDEEFNVRVKVLNLDLSVETVEMASAKSAKELKGAIDSIMEPLILAGLSVKAREEHAWQQAKEEDTPEAYADFLGKYPKSSHTTEAREALKRAEQARDTAAWRVAKSQNTERTYENFLREYPQSRYANQATEALKRLLAAKHRTLDLGKGVTMKLVRIPAGEFMMGSPASEQGRDNDEAQHKVKLTKVFYMGITEVTQQQYEAVMGTNPSKFKGASNPVEQVSWDDAQVFCEKLTSLAGYTVRLPTEAEWEYACRAGSTIRFSFGDSYSLLGGYAWYSSNSGERSHAVATRKVNVWGLHDMHGNVWEWCSDWYAESYAFTDNVNPQGPDSGSSRVLRGGSWFNSAQNCRCANRLRITPDYRNNGNGFRVVLHLK